MDDWRMIDDTTPYDVPLIVGNAKWDPGYWIGIRYSEAGKHLVSTTTKCEITEVPAGAWRVFGYSMEPMAPNDPTHWIPGPGKPPSIG